jgi:hypothetical protein
MVHPAQLKQPLYTLFAGHGRVGCGIGRLGFSVTSELSDNPIHQSIVAKKVSLAQSAKHLAHFLQAIAFCKRQQRLCNVAPIEMISLSCDDTFRIGDVPGTHCKQLLHQQIFGRTREQFAAALELEERRPFDHSFLKRKRPKCNIDRNLLLRLYEQDTISPGEFGRL